MHKFIILKKLSQKTFDPKTFSKNKSPGANHVLNITKYLICKVIL